jgi:hypothetical protein
MSLAALAIVLVHFARYGVVYEADEGTSAHLFQILILLEVPIVGYFALTSLPAAPGPALRVLALQAAAVGAAFASVYFLTGG